MTLGPAARWAGLLAVSVLGSAATTPPPLPVSTTLPGTTTTTSTTLPPPGGQSGPYTITIEPCATAPCRVTPQSVRVTYPPGAPPPAVEVGFVASGRPPGAPRPGSDSVVLTISEATACGSAACWPWPAGLRDGPWVLNGTYQLAACAGSLGAGASATCSDPFPAVTAGVAVPPAAPASVTASASRGAVTVSWTPAARPEPDLAGYTVTRDGTTVYDCAFAGLAPGPPCPAPLTATDSPGPGRFTYAVSALRLGAGPASLVASVPLAAGPVALVPPGGPPVSEGGGTPLPSVPVTASSPTGTLPAPSPVVSRPAAPSTSLAAPANLAYPTVKAPPALAVRTPPPASPGTDIVPVAVLALGILSLAVAAHVLYVRVAVGRFGPPRRGRGAG